MLSLNNIYTTFKKNTPDEVKLFEDLNLHINKGEFVSIIGSNGSGKTTLLNLICGTYQPDSGSIIMNGKDITKLPEYKRSKIISRVYQDPHMGTCSSLSILENFALADNKNKAYNLTGAINKKRINYYKELVSKCNMGLEDRMGTQVGSLSGGQRQAIALVIAGMTNVDLLILDEHTAALDPKSSETVMELTNNLVKDSNLTAIMISHNLRFATEYGNRLLMMHQGKVILDKNEEEKKNTKIDDILTLFNQISIESGN